MLFIPILVLQLNAILKNPTYVEETTDCYEGSHCQTCSLYNNLLCYSCQPGYGLELDSDGNSIGTCEICLPSHCISCDSNNQFCTKCDSPYYLTRYPNGEITGECGECSVSNCYECDTFSDSCKECQDGYGRKLNEDGTYSCHPCDENCEQCSEDYKVCTKCKSKYGFTYENNVNTGKCKSCSDKACASCASNAEQCDEWICPPGEGPVLVNFKVTDECRPCNARNCADCSSDYTKCKACPDKTIANWDNLGKVTECKECTANCDRCLSGGECQVNGCSLGYGIYWNAWNAHDGNLCKKCELSHCVDCYDNNVKCKRC